MEGESTAPFVLKVHRRPGRNWIVSFSDLLTLVLCFFITIISISLQYRHQPAAAGTRLAPSVSTLTGDVLPSVVTFGAEHFNGDGIMFSTEGRNYLEGLGKAVFSQARMVTVTACAAEQGQSGELRRFQLTGRLLAIASQLIDDGVSREKLRLVTHGTGCVVTEGIQHPVAQVSVR